MADWGKHQAIDIILGVKEMLLHYYPDTLCCPDRKVEVKRSIFGWLLRGRTDSPTRTLPEYQSNSYGGYG